MERPRLSLPPRVLWLRDWDKVLKVQEMAKIKHGRGCYFLKPF